MNPTIDVQAVWEEFESHMTKSLKGKAEKCQLHTYVTTNTLDQSWRVALNSLFFFNEQFRQLDEVFPPDEILPYTTSLTLLQTAFHAIPELKIVETMKEFLSLTSFSTDSNLDYESYFALLQNACISDTISPVISLFLLRSNNSMT